MRCALLPSDSGQVHFYTRKLRKYWTRRVGRRERDGGTSGVQQMGVICWLSAGTEEGQEKNRLCQFFAQLSFLCFILLFPVSPSGSQPISRLRRRGGCDRLQTDLVTP